jgi:NADP-dependent 3-hydroxy acid dehydrogenase YdfG
MNQQKENDVQRIAVVTGALSGIGKATTELLAENGFYVFAMARRKDRLEQIRSENIEPIPLDVTDVAARRLE